MNIDAATVIAQVKPMSDRQKDILVALDDYYAEHDHWPSACELADSIPGGAVTRFVASDTLGRLRKRRAVAYIHRRWQLRDPTITAESTPAERELLEIITTYYQQHTTWPTAQQIAAVKSAKQYHDTPWLQHSFPTLTTFETVYQPQRFVDMLRGQLQSLRRRGYLNATIVNQAVIVSNEPTAN